MERTDHPAARQQRGHMLGGTAVPGVDVVRAAGVEPDRVGAGHDHLAAQRRAEPGDQRPVRIPGQGEQDNLGRRRSGVVRHRRRPHSAGRKPPGEQVRTLRRPVGGPGADDHAVPADRQAQPEAAPVLASAPDDADAEGRVGHVNLSIGIRRRHPMCAFATSIENQRLSPSLTGRRNRRRTPVLTLPLHALAPGIRPAAQSVQRPPGTRGGPRERQVPHAATHRRRRRPARPSGGQ
jgi:hypothetical protein